MKIRNSKILFILLAFCTVAFSSCKKNYSCRCGTTIIFGMYGQDYFISKTSPLSQKMTKKQAQAVCDHEAKNINDTYLNLVTNNGNYSSGDLRATTNCNLE